ncbi:MAG: AbrB/MazE/SpoVT family DNA-binding domain-containing protein [Defluviitaleaceae bacterium]|nr:AbrB/MazE/SpoVT family DNA-binding domain-containing protein [Defluviitaleaceae bacterium]
MNKKTVGIIRNLDELGRIVIPIEMRRTLGIEVRDGVEISLEGDSIMIAKHQASDVFTGEKSEDLVEYNGKKVSKKTIRELVKLLD